MPKVTFDEGVPSPTERLQRCPAPAAPRPRARTIVRSSGAEQDRQRSLHELQTFTSMLRETVRELDALPASLCPNDEAVVSFWFRHHGRPQEDLLRAMSRITPVRVVGSRAPRPMPPPSPEPAAEWFVAGSRASFRRISEEAATWRPSQRRGALAGTVARVNPPVPNERVRARWGESATKALEVVLHAGGGAEDRHIVEGFRRYLRDLGLRPHRDRVLFAGKLGFLGLTATAEEALEVARFAFVRVVREMPRLRLQRPSPPCSGELQTLSRFAVPSPVYPTDHAAPQSLSCPSVRCGSSKALGFLVRPSGGVAPSESPAARRIGCSDSTE